MEIDSRIKDCLACPKCRVGIVADEGGWLCGSCQQKYPVIAGQSFFRDPVERNRLVDGGRGVERNDSVILGLKAFAKRWPNFFLFLYKVAAPFIGKTAEKFVAEQAQGSLILNLGSGAKIIAPGVINVDYDAFPGVGVVTDVQALPFKDGSVDAIISESVLEHLPNPQLAVAEISRVLRSAGGLYVVTPFMLGYHSSPRDYYRWTEYGMSELLKNFELKESGSAWGPTVAVASVGGAWLALILSFGSSKLYQFWVVFFIFFFAIFTRVDHLLKFHPRAKDNAHGLYFVAIKK